MNKLLFIAMGMSCFLLGHIIEAQECPNWTEATPTAPWSGRNAFGSLNYNGRIWVLGGNDGGYRNDVWSSTDGTNWTQITPAAAWSPRSDLGAVVFSGKMWVFGGDDGSGHLNDVWSSTDGTNWTQVTPAAPWTGRYDFGTVVFNAKLWVLGGYNYPTDTRFNDVWSSSDGSNWTQVTSAASWSPRALLGAVAFNGQMWVLGGNNVTRYNDVWSSPDGTNWTQVTPASAWSARSAFGTVVTNGQMWVLGGDHFDGLTYSYTNDVWSSSDGTNWTQATPAASWSARSQLGLVLFNEQMCVLGGLNGSGRLNDVWSSQCGGITAPCPLGTNWTEVTSAAPWSARWAHAGLAFNGRIWVMGGNGSAATYLNDVWSSIDGTNWSEATPAAPWSARYSPGAVVLNGAMWVMGGFGNGAYLNDVWSSTDGTNWTQATGAAPWSGRENPAAVTLNGKMWVLGGYRSGTYFNDVWSSPDGTNWTQATSAAPWSARASDAAVAFNGQMWILGGSTSTCFKDVWSSPDGTNWTQVTSAAPWGPRAGHRAVVLDGAMWVLGGSDCGLGDYLSNDVWSSSDGTNWTQATPAAPWSPRQNHPAVVFNGRMCVLGGKDNSGYLNDVWSSGCSSFPSPFQIAAITRQGKDILVTWTCEGGFSNVLQSTRSTATIAAYNTNFADVSPIVVMPGIGASTTNYLDAGAAYAPALIPPTQVAPTSGVASLVTSSAQYTRGLADSLGNAVSVGSVLMLGTFTISETIIQSNFLAGNVSAILSNFTPYATSFAVGNGTALPASWSVSQSAAGFDGQQMYLLAIDKPTFAAATHLGIFTAPSWTFPVGGGTNTIDLEDVTDFVIGTQGGSLTINLPVGGETYTFADTAKLSVLPGRILFYRVRLAQ